MSLVITGNDTYHRLRTVPLTQTDVLVIPMRRDFCADENHWTEGLEPPHCSTLSGSSGSNCHGCFFLLWLPYCDMWFFCEEQVCPSAGIWAQVLWSLPAHLHDPALLWELALLQSTFVLVYMCFSCLYIVAFPAQIL